MAGYAYIIAGFPDLVLNFNHQPLDREEVFDYVRELLPSGDRRMVKLLEFGLTPDNLTEHFYAKVNSCGNHFLKEYFAFDRAVRAAKVEYLAQKGLVPAGSAPAYDSSLLDRAKLDIIFSTDNLIEREKLLDNLLWTKSSEIVQFDILDLNTILSCLVRFDIASRWSALDDKSGTELFKRYVDEVRGTFKGINDTAL